MFFYYFILHFIRFYYIALHFIIRVFCCWKQAYKILIQLFQQIFFLSAFKVKQMNDCDTQQF